jgi:uncharacterized protein YceK
MKRVEVLLAAGLAGWLTAGCGSVIRPTTSGATTGTASTGNWQIAGQTGTTQLPALALSLAAGNGNVYLSGTFFEMCGGLALGTQFNNVVAPLGTGGSFSVDPTGGQVAVTISGMAPAAGATSWSGTYTLEPNATGAGISCVAAPSTAAFTATMLPSLSGTYTGTVSGGADQSMRGTISLNLTQGHETSGVVNGNSVSYVPLGGTVTFSGISCFTQGISVAGPGSEAGGDGFQQTFQMNDGSEVVLNASSWPVSGSALLVGFSVVGGACDQVSFGGKATLQ